MPAVGFGMGDVVLSNVLTDKGLKPEHVAPRPDAFVLALTDAGSERLLPLVAQLRERGLHVRFSYKSTRNLGKLMKDANACRSRFAVILDDKAAAGQASLKNLDTNEQSDAPLSDVAAKLAR